MPADRAPVDRQPITEAELRRVWIGKPPKLGGPILLHDYDPEWPGLFAREEVRLRAVLGDRVLRLEHVGSTAVPGLAAKPIIDILLILRDSADEAAYLPDLEAAGYILRIREPEWYEHRAFTGPDTSVNLHVFSPACRETKRMLAFRDWLRVSEDDRRRYETAKRDLASRDWEYVQNYADAKTALVEEIIERSLAARAPVRAR